MLLLLRMLKMQSLLRDTPDPDKPDPGAPNPNPNPEPNKDIESLKTQLAELQNLIKAQKPDPKPDDSSLADKVRKEREAAEEKSNQEKILKSALNFTLTSKDFLKNNESLLPKSIGSIFEAAEKQNYSSEIDKANDIKVGIVSEFFAQQENLDLLTASQKIQLEDFKKLTKDIKGERVAQVYDSIFEPTFEAKKKIEKAKQVAEGLGDPSGSENAYNKRMQGYSTKHYLKGKGEN